MYRTSSAYKSEMKQDLRDRSYVYVYLGLVNREAQAAASIDSELIDFAQTDIFDNSRFEGYYATYEENFIKANGSFFYMPDPHLYRALNQGAVTPGMSGTITFVFSKTIDKFGGLTIDFGDNYPTKFTATNGHNTYTFENDTAGLYIAEGNFYDSDYITITPISMVNGEKRLRIHSIMFGIGFQFGNKELISTKRTNVIDHLSNELPKKTFEFTIDNRNQKWSMDNPKSYARALDEMQIVSVTYGRELPDGSIFKIPNGYMALQTWSSTHTTATFKAIGFLDYSNTTYYGGKVERKSLYDMALEVFEDMGTTNYKLDSFLKKLYTNNPLPIDQHKSCLQMIANAGLCTMYEDGNGVITIKSSMKLPRYVMTIDNIEVISNRERLMNGDPVYNYATFENNYFRADGSLKFIDTPDEPKETGVWSYLYPTEDEFKITIEFEAVWTFVGFLFRFGIVTPTVVTIDEYNDEHLRETHDYQVDGETFGIDHEFYEVDKVVIKFTNPDGTRIHLNKMIIGAFTDYQIDKHDWKQYPTATQTDRIRSINVKYYSFLESDKKVSTKVEAEAGDNLITFSTPCFDYNIEGCEILDSGAYYVVFSAHDEGEVTVTAKAYDKAENTYSYQLRETGQDIVLANDLISDADLAERVCEWLTEYYSGEIDYTITYRGEPALESGDRIYLESDFVDNNLILVTSEELTTSTGMAMNNKVTARQLQYTVRE